MSDAMEEIIVVDIDNNKFYAPPKLLDKRSSLPFSSLPYLLLSTPSLSLPRANR